MGLVLREVSSLWHSLKLNCRRVIPKGKGAFTSKLEGRREGNQHLLYFFRIWGKRESNR